MNEDLWPDFDRTSRLFGRILKMRPEVPTQAIFWLYPRHYPPQIHMDLVRFAQKGREGSPPPLAAFWVSFPMKVFKLLVWTTYLTLVSWYARLLFMARAKDLKPHTLAQSFIVNPRMLSEDRDFYFGDFADKMTASGKGVVFLIRNASGLNHFQFVKKTRAARAGGVSRFPDFLFMGFLGPIKMGFRQILSSLRLKRMATKAKRPLTKETLLQCALSVLSGETSLNALWFEIGRNAVGILKPRAFVTLYEGHGWEKLAWAGAHQGFENVLTVGFQHTFLFRESYSMTKPVSGLKGYERPELILALGQKTRDKMEKGGRSKIIPFGSFRHSAQLGSLQDAKLKTVLVTPEGLPKEMILMFSFAFDCARLDPSIQYIFRCHPVLPFEKIESQLPSGIRQQPNIQISSTPQMADDFQKSSVNLFRRSSSVLYAVLAGLKPIYLEQPGQVESNPIADIGGFLDACREPQELVSLMNKETSLPLETRESDWEQAVRFVQDYAFKASDGSVKLYLDTVEELRKRG